jgi:hypothetical protein
LRVGQLLGLLDGVADQGVDLAQLLLRPAGVDPHQLLRQRGLQLHHVQRVALDVVQLTGEPDPLARDGQLGLVLACLLQLVHEDVERLVGEHEPDRHSGDGGRDERVLEQELAGVLIGHQRSQRADSADVGDQCHRARDPQPRQLRHDQRTHDGEAVERRGTLGHQHTDQPDDGGDGQAEQSDGGQVVVRPPHDGEHRRQRAHDQENDLPPAPGVERDEQYRDRDEHGELRGDVQPAHPAAGRGGALGHRAGCVHCGSLSVAGRSSIGARW